MSTDSKLILVGQIAGGFGVRGEVRVTAYTAEPMALLSYGPLLRADGSVGLTLTSARPDKNGVVGRAKEIATKEQADALRGLKLHIPRDRLPEPEAVAEEAPAAEAAAEEAPAAEAAAEEAPAAEATEEEKTEA